MAQVEGSIRINLLGGLALNDSAPVGRTASAAQTANPTVKVIFDLRVPTT